MRVNASDITDASASVVRQKAGGAGTVADHHQPASPRSEALASRAMRPLLDTLEGARSVCGLCKHPLTHLFTEVEGHGLTLLSCSKCAWHTRLIDGRLATQRDVQNILDETWNPPTRREDALTWYRSESRAARAVVTKRVHRNGTRPWHT